MSCDAVAANKAFHEKFDFAFPLLSDVDKSMTKAFGVCKPAKDGSDPCDTVWKSKSVSWMHLIILHCAISRQR